MSGRGGGRGGGDDPRDGGGDRHFMQRRGPNSSLYVRPIDGSTRPDELKSLFASYGKIRDVHIPIDFNTRQPRGFAYVEYENINDAERAQEKINKTKLNDTLLHVDFAQGDRKTPGQMKTQKEAVALRLQIDELRKMQEDQRKRARNAEMEREGIPTSGQDRSRGRRFNTPPRGRHDPYEDRRGGGGRRDDRRGGERGGGERGRRDDDRRRPHGGDRRDQPVRDDRRGGDRGERRRDRSRSPQHRGERDRDDRRRNFQEDRPSGHEERSRPREDHRGGDHHHRSGGREDRGGRNGRDERGAEGRGHQEERRTAHYGHDDRAEPPRGGQFDQHDDRRGNRDERRNRDDHQPRR